MQNAQDHTLAEIRQNAERPRTEDALAWLSHIFKRRREIQTDAEAGASQLKPGRA
jgi:hypothetical protein